MRNCRFGKARLGSAHCTFRENLMRLTPPSAAVFIISVVIALLAIVAEQGTRVPVIGENPFWSLAAAWGLLVVGSLFRRI